MKKYLMHDIAQAIIDTDTGKLTNKQAAKMLNMPVVSFDVMKKRRNSYDKLHREIWNINWNVKEREAALHPPNFIPG